MWISRTIVYMIKIGIVNFTPYICRTVEKYYAYECKLIQQSPSARTAACFIMLTIYIQQATIVKNSEIHALAKWKEHESRVNLALIRSKLILSYIYKILDGVHFI